MAKILVVEDEQHMVSVLRDALELENYVVEIVGDGREGLDRLKFYDYDLAILDWGLPLMSGIEVLEHYRKTGGQTPILMLTGKDQIPDRQTGLDYGADDYLVKPFDMRELLARLRAMLRRPKQMTESVLSLGNTRLDARKFQTWVDGKPLSLLPKELQLLEFFMRYPEQVFSQTALLNRVWPNDCEATNQAFRSALKRLRKKLEEAGSNCQITAIYGVGYKFEKADME